MTIAACPQNDLSPEDSHDQCLAIANALQPILRRDRLPTDCAYEISQLRELIEPIASFQIDPDQPLTEGRIELPQGLAISPAQAAMCFREHARTAAFLKGLYYAIQDLTEKNPGITINVLYAGCGPYALLALPLMTVLERDQARFTLLDINRDSLDHAKQLIENFGLSSFINGYINEDACTHQVPNERRPHIIVSETMNACLESEPQVAVERNLLGQCPQAIMIPERVTVDACLEKAGQKANLIELGPIFSLDKESIASWQDIRGEHLPAGSIRIIDMDQLDLRNHIMLTLRITIYQDVTLGNRNSSLNYSRKLRSIIKSPPLGDLDFEYKLGKKPSLTLRRTESPFSSPESLTVRILREHIGYNEQTDSGAARTKRIVDFLREIGFVVEYTSLNRKTFVPGIDISKGVIRVDKAQLAFPGDILHEAGHLAVLPAEERCKAKPDVSHNPGDELAAIAWSWAALKHIDLPPEAVFHSAGYRGGSQSIIDNFSNNHFFGVPMLQYYSMSYELHQAEKHGEKPFPHMQKWMRD